MAVSDFLIFDSNADNQALYTELAIVTGANPVIIKDFAELSAQVTRQQPALLLIDSQQPDGDGYQLLNQVLSTRLMVDIPVLFTLSNLSERKQMLYGNLFRRATPVAKPARVSILRDLLVECLDVARWRAEIQALLTQDANDSSQSLSEGLLALNADGEILYANGFAEQLLATTVLNLRRQHIASILEDKCESVFTDWKAHPISRVTESQQILQVNDTRFWRADGERVKVGFAAVPVPAESELALLIAFKSKEGSRESNEKLSQLTRRDVLTGLPNRIATEEQIDRSLQRSKGARRHCAILAVDLDHFHHINESLGHDCGDALMREVAERITALLRTEDFVGRMEGDEFIVVLPLLESPHHAAVVANKLVERLRQPYLLDGHQVYSGASVGISLFPEGANQAADLIVMAESAVQRAKALGRNNFQFFSAELNRARLQSLRLEQALLEAMQTQPWRVQFEPVYEGRSQALVLCQVQVSWPHPALGELPLAQFLTELEDSGLCRAFFEWLWRTALARFSATVGADESAVSISLPISLITLGRSDSVDWLVTVAREYGVEPGRIHIELAESHITTRQQSSRALLAELARLGFRLMLDQFGAGVAPYLLLRDIPYTVIRLPDTCIAGCTTTRADKALVTHSVALARDLGVMVLAGNVDTAEQHEWLCAAGCDWYAGEYVAVHLIPHADTPAGLVQLLSSQ